MADVDKQNEKDPPQDLMLMWTNHTEVLREVMQALRHKERFADVTVICGDKQFAVHQFVLSTCSLYLEALFRSIPDGRPMLILPDTPPKAMEKLLDFMYLGQAELSQDEFHLLLDLAEELEIKGLIETSNDTANQSWSLSWDKDGKKGHGNPIKGRGSATFNDTSETSKTTNQKNWSLSWDKDCRKSHGSLRKDRASATVNDTSKTTNRKICQNSRKGAVKKYAGKKTKEAKTVPKEAKTVKGKSDQSQVVASKPDRRKNRVSIEKFKKPTTPKDPPEGGQVINTLLSCPECPFRTLSVPTMTQHKYKHSLGKPYMCPYCNVRHSVEELHIAHQKRNHPKMKVVINKSVNLGLGQSEECVSLASCPSNVNQTSKNNQVGSSQLPPKSYIEAFDSFINNTESQMSPVKTEVNPESEMSLIKREVTLESEMSLIETEVNPESEMSAEETEVNLEREMSIEKTEFNFETEVALAKAEANLESEIPSLKTEINPEIVMPSVKTEISLQLREQSESKPSMLSSPDFHTHACVLQPVSNTQKTGKRRRVSTSRDSENSKRPYIELGLRRRTRSSKR